MTIRINETKNRRYVDEKVHPLRDNNKDCRFIRYKKNNKEV
jgi:hypothetical protein